MAGVLLLVNACEPEPGPGPEAKHAVEDATTIAVEPVFAFQAPRGVRLMKADTTIAEVNVPAVDAEWAADGSRFVVSTGDRLVSIDARTGAVVEADCACREIAVAAGKVFTAQEYGAEELKVHDARTLAPQGTVEVGGGVTSVGGAGDRVVLFRIAATGARDLTDVVVLDPATGGTTRVGATSGPVTATAFTPRGWWGGPLFAYARDGSSGASTGEASVVWFDPTSQAEQVETSDQELRETTPGVAEGNWNSGRDHLWWAADGTLRTAAWTWSCTHDQPLSGPQCAAPSARNQWRYDGAAWARTDERDLDSVRDIGGGASLELGRGDQDKPLALVRGETRTPLAEDVRQLWTPPQPGPPQPGGVGSPELARRYAPTVWLHHEEEKFPTNASDYIRGAELHFDHGDDCGIGNEDLVAADPDPTRLGRGHGYRHKAAERSLGTCKHLEHGRMFASNAPVDKPGGKRFFLDGEDDLRGGNRPGEDRRVRAPVYWEHIPAKDGRRSAYVYWFFYAYNDFLNNHEGDWERVAVQLDGEQPVAVSFNRHGGACHVRWEDLNKSGDRAEVFSAKGSHGSYPKEDEYPTHPIGTDHTDKGFEWNTADELLSVREQPWYGYRGIWGSVGNLSNVGFTGSTGPAGPWPMRDLSGMITAGECEK